MTEMADRIAELERELAKIKDIAAQAFLAGALLARAGETQGNYIHARLTA